MTNTMAKMKYLKVIVGNVAMRKPDVRKRLLN